MDSKNNYSLANYFYIVRNVKIKLVIPRGLPRGALQFLLLTLAKRADFGFLRRNTPRLAVGIGAGRAERIYSAVDALSALAQESRLSIFRLLVQTGKDDLAAGRLGEKLGIPPATMSFHLKGLAHAKLINFR